MYNSISTIQLDMQMASTVVHLRINDEIYLISPSHYHCIYLKLKVKNFMIGFIVCFIDDIADCPEIWNIFFSHQNSLMLGRNSERWMPCMMSSKAKSIGHGRKFTSQSWRNIWNSVWNYGRAILPKRVFISIKIYVNR